LSVRSPIIDQKPAEDHIAVPPHRRAVRNGQLIAGTVRCGGTELDLPVDQLKPKSGPKGKDPESEPDEDS
jgi:hypothetical protein